MGVSKKVRMPTASIQFTTKTMRPVNSNWIGRPQVHSDEDGNSYLLFHCVGCEVSISLSDDDLKFLACQINERLEEVA